MKFLNLLPVTKWSRPSRLRKCLASLLLVSFFICMILGISVLTDNDILELFFTSNDKYKDMSHKQADLHHLPRDRDQIAKERLILLQKLRKQENGENIVAQNDRLIEKKPHYGNTTRPLLKIPIADMANLGQKQHKGEENKNYGLNYNVHLFYYAWYGNPEFDGMYLHWNHRYLPHWNKREDRKWPKGRHKPPEDIGSNFYPELGTYSSKDPKVIENHMQQAVATGAGVLSVSWYPPGQADDEGKPNEELIPMLLDHAHKYKLKICFHIEPYSNRTSKSLKENLKLIIREYGSHPAFYRHLHNGRELPLYYIYDSYLVSKEDWGSLFRPDGANTVRNSELDGIFIGLVVEEKHKVDLMASGFDGYYTYFASDSFTYGSSTRHWLTLASYANANEALFIPSVGPGYIDTNIRPWNSANTRDRKQGGYYEQSFKAALAVYPKIVTITSFNEWGEGTQIEKAIPKKPHSNSVSLYEDYLPNKSDFYLQVTKKWVRKFSSQSRS